MKSNIVAFSGDLLNRQTNRNKRRHSLIGSTEEEVLLGFSDVFNDVDFQHKESNHVLRTKHECKAYPQIQCSNYPRCHEFNVKIFINEIGSGVVNDAVRSILDDLSLTFVDNLIVSLTEKVSTRDLDIIWKQMERMKNVGRVGAIGVADLSVAQLNHLIDWSSICPDLTQICPLNYDDTFRSQNSSVKQLTEIGQKHNIRITTHNDPVSSPDKLALDLDTLLDNSGKSWNTRYIARYTQRSKDRNIITMKGYCMGINQL